MKSLKIAFIICLLPAVGLMGQSYGYHESVDFESNVNFIRIDNSPGNAWQVGSPQKLYFDSAYSVPRAIVTDTVAPYPVDNHSTFYLSVKDINWFMGSPSRLSFYHKFDTDTLADGGFIDVSYDGGDSWINIIYDSTMYNCNWTVGWGYWGYHFYEEEDVLYDGTNGFSGQSDGWEYAEFNWQYCLGVEEEFPDSMMIRFHFISDGEQTGKEGWMIDNIVLHSDLCGGVQTAAENPVPVVLAPHPVVDASVLQVRGTAQPEGVLTICDQQGRQIFTGAIHNGSFPLGTLNLEKGLYFYALKWEDGTAATGKFIRN